MSKAVLAELLDVLSCPKILRRTDVRDVEAGFDMVMARSVMFEPSVAVTDCRDAKDNMYLALALRSRAHTVISSDADLLVLSPWRFVAIMTPARYLATSDP